MKKRQLTTSKKKPPTERIIKDIRTLRDSGKSDEEIRNLLRVELRTYQRYTKTIYEQDQSLWIKITQQEYATELLNLRSCINNAFNIAKALSEDSKLDCQDRLDSIQTMLDARISMVQLLGDVDMIRKIPSSSIRTDAETKPYEERYEWRERGEQVSKSNQNEK
jgi:hypothetical protein